MGRMPTYAVTVHFDGSQSLGVIRMQVLQLLGGTRTELRPRRFRPSCSRHFGWKFGCSSGRNSETAVVVGDFVSEKPEDPGFFTLRIAKAGGPGNDLQASSLQDLFRLARIMNRRAHEIQKLWPVLKDSLECPVLLDLQGARVGWFG
ncbi:MAG TPA: hypothetical protein VGS27_19530 [Candidatus Sulfotelmatobacter sp.]|nr:hypothetical protein [Candidatus Sulfotelmatobacter sp.]